jgi:hypothetical protein
MVLIDLSDSIKVEDRSLYAESFKSILQSLKPGDRVMLANIGEQGRSSFRLASDTLLPRTGVRLDDEEAGAKARAELQTRFDEFSKTAGSQRNATLILDAVSAAAEALQPKAENSSYLVLYSDMVHESRIANFAKVKPNIKLLDTVKQAHLLPQMSGVNVLVCGAAGEYYTETQAFWEAYFQAAGAQLKNYGRLAIKNL